MLKFHQWTVWIAVTLVFASTINPARAQLTRGFISGTVTDASQALVPGVLVSITNKLTGISRETVSTDAGFYRFVAVEPGARVTVGARSASLVTSRRAAVSGRSDTIRSENVRSIVGFVFASWTPGVSVTSTSVVTPATFRV